MLDTTRKHNLFALGVETYFYSGNPIDFESGDLAEALGITEEQLLDNDRLFSEAVKYIKRNERAIEAAAATTKPYWRSLTDKLTKLYGEGG